MWNTGIFCNGGTVTPRKPQVATPEIGAIVIYGKKGFCGFLGGSYASVSVSVGPLALKKMGISLPHCYTV
jgi:hypothetical protein